MGMRPHALLPRPRVMLLGPRAVGMHQQGMGMEQQGLLPGPRRLKTRDFSATAKKL